MRSLWNLEYEQCALGSMILDNTVIDLALEKIKPEMFSPKNRAVFEEISRQYAKNGMCEALSLIPALSGTADAAYVAGLTDKVASVSNAGFYLDELKKLWMARELQSAVAQAGTEITGDTGLDVASRLDSKIMSLMGTTNGSAVTAGELVSGLIDDMQNKYLLTKEHLGYSTGWKKFDEILDGTQKGQLYFLSARASIGKTAFALAWMRSLMKQKIPCVYFSYEMGSRQLALRLVSAESGVPITKITGGFALQSQGLMARMSAAFQAVSDSCVKIYDSSCGLGDKNTLYSRIRVEAKKSGAKVFFIDQLSLIPSCNPALPERQQIGIITKRLLHLAQELDVAIICLCQLNRGAEGQKPNLSELKGSGSIEEDADVVILLNRKRLDGSEEELLTKAVVAKNRNGATGTANMLFVPNCATFVEGDNSGKEDKE